MRVEYIHADCVQGLHAMADVGWCGHIDSVVTSPPYAEIRADEYGTPGIPEDAYGQWTRMWAEAALSLVKPSGLLVLNIGFKWNRRVLSFYHGQAVGACISAGWIPVQELVWWKPNANPIIGPLVTSSHEPIYVFARDPEKMYDGSDDIRGEYSEASLRRFGRKFVAGGVKGDIALPASAVRDPNPHGPRPQSVRAHAPGKEKGNTHPAPMPLDLATELVLLSVPQGGYVLDPFGGSGTTAVAAVQQGRNAVLIDYEKKWLDIARGRVYSGARQPGSETLPV